MERLASACQEPYGLLVLFLSFTGLRFGEVAALRVRHLDLLRRRAEVTEAVTEIAAAGGVLYAQVAPSAVRAHSTVHR